MTRRTALLSLTPAALLGGAEISAAAAKAHIPRLRKCLQENILGFWLPRTIDKANGGYIISFGPRGESKGPGPRGIVTQARHLWLFARAFRGGFGDLKTLLAAADHGWRYLNERMWDKQHGGFYWEVNAEGVATNAAKHLYGQSFALYALSEFALAAKRKDALDMATLLFGVLDNKAYDKQYGGYRESFERNWTHMPDGARGPMGDASFKLMNTHLHLLESMTAYYRASQSPLAKERLLELIAIESNTVVRKGLTACTDKYNRDWTPRLEGNLARVSYGHDLENIWLIADACKAAGVAVHPYIDLFRALFDYSLEYGFDREHGGFFYTGAFRKPSDDLQKSWWVQAEAMVSAVYMYRLTGEKKYLDVFDRTWRFVDQYQVDWTNGEWWGTVGADLKGRGDKANIWKAGYHNGRAMIECMEQLQPA